MREIPLTQGYVAIVDDADYDRLASRSWQALRLSPDHVYAVHMRRTGGKGGGRVVRVYMHRELMGAESQRLIDHANGNTLDNRRENLRFATPSQNAQNSRKRPGCTSMFKGVSWHKRSRRWRAKIKANGQEQHLGSFLTEDAAREAYQQAAARLHGAFARL
ncbi:MAG TPA: HNH endonuclease [Planctomycetota bacterium]|nr:HNH endonuclease [Planctomycetota bacterium]